MCIYVTESISTLLLAYTILTSLFLPVRKCFLNVLIRSHRIAELCLAKIIESIEF